MKDIKAYNIYKPTKPVCTISSQCWCQCNLDNIVNACWYQYISLWTCVYSLWDKVCTLVLILGPLKFMLTSPQTQNRTDSTFHMLLNLSQIQISIWDDIYGVVILCCESWIILSAYYLIHIPNMINIIMIWPSADFTKCNILSNKMIVTQKVVFNCFICV